MRRRSFISHKYQSMISLMLLAAISLMSLKGHTSDKNTNAGISDEKLNSLIETLESKRKQFKIPGMAIAIVKDGKVILSHGFGYSNVKDKIAVTPQTVFAIGSTSKAFTATMIGMANDKGQMAWDDKVTKHLNWFKPNLNDHTGELTIRDMLSHRSGVSRNDILWASGKVGREALMRESLDAEPLDKFRKKFNYNNVMFLAAGMANSKAVGADNWDVLLDDLILKPLSMNDTTSRHGDTSSKLAVGYRWDESSNAFEALEHKNIDNVGPAGSITSNVTDMVKWVTFNLNKGAKDGEQLLSAQAFDQMWSPQIKIAGNVGYGMGWFIRDWNGKKVLEHGGNIQGYAAQIAMIPEEKIGYVLLTNVSMTPLQQGSMELVFDGLLGKDNGEDRAKKNSGDDQHKAYVGDYVANFGPFKNTDFTVKVQDGDLAVNVPGQRLFKLKEPDESGKRYFQITNTIAISFEKKTGQVIAMRLHQNGMDFELPRKGYTPLSEVDIATFKPYVGTYTSKAFPAPLKVLIQNNRLALDVPGQMVYELHLPNNDNHRPFRINKAMTVKFSYNDDRSVKGLSVYRGDQLNLNADKQINAQVDVDLLPTTAEVLKLRGGDGPLKLFKKLNSVQLLGTVTMKQAGVAGKITSTAQGKGQSLQVMDFGDYGITRNLLTKTVAATDGLQPYTELTGVLYRQAKNEHPISELDWGNTYDNITVKRKIKVNDKDVILVELFQKGLPAMTAAIDAKTGDLLRRKGQVLVKDIGPIPMEIKYSDYRDVNGLRIPFRINVFTPMAGNVLIEYEKAETGKKFDDSFFSLK